MTITKVALAGGKAVVVEQQTASGGERDFQVLFAKNPLPAWVYSVMTLSILEVNDAAVNRYGWTRKEFLRMRVTDLYPPQEMLRLVDTLRSDSVLLEDNGQWQHCLSDGRIIDIEVRSRRLKLGKQEVVLLVAQDITECKREEISLQRNNSFKDRFCQVVLDRHALEQ